MPWASRARKELARIQHWETPQERGQDVGMWVGVRIIPGEGTSVRHGSGMSRLGLVRPVSASHRHVLLADCELQLCLGRVLGQQQDPTWGHPLHPFISTLSKSARSQNVCLFFFLTLPPFLPVLSENPLIFLSEIPCQAALSLLAKANHESQG